MTSPRSWGLRPISVNFKASERSWRRLVSEGPSESSLARGAWKPPQYSDAVPEGRLIRSLDGRIELLRTMVRFCPRPGSALNASAPSLIMLTSCCHFPRPTADSPATDEAIKPSLRDAPLLFHLPGTSCQATFIAVPPGPICVKTARSL
jgi:hypothetical protein